MLISIIRIELLKYPKNFFLYTSHYLHKQHYFVHVSNDFNCFSCKMLMIINNFYVYLRFSLMYYDFQELLV